MLFATTLQGGTFAVTSATIPTTPPPTPPSTAPTAPTPSKGSLFTTSQYAFTRQPTLSLPYTCTADLCTGTADTDFVFRTLQNLINMANVQAARNGLAAAAAIAVDGRVDKRMLAAYMPVSRAVGGTLAIFDFTPTPEFLAKNARTFAQTIAQWLGMTWVEATPLVPGHWERLRAGQTSVLPAPPSTAPSQPSPDSGRPRPLPLPLPQPQPQPQPQPVMTMFVCPDGTRVSDLSACPKQQPQPQPQQQPQQQPQLQPQPQQQPTRVDVGPTVAPPPGSTKPPEGPRQFPGSEPPPTSRRYAGCIARFNKTRKAFSIYCPIGAAVPAGLGLADEYFKCLYGDCGGLGATDAVTPPVPTGFNPTPVVVTTTLPGEGETPAGEEKDKFFRASNPLMWVLFAGTAAAIGGGGYWVVRRRRRAA